MPVAAIKIDRWPHGPRALEYANLLITGVELPPIKVHFRDGHWRVGDGRHRLLAHKLVGKDIIMVRRAVRERRNG